MKITKILPISVFVIIVALSSCGSKRQTKQQYSEYPKREFRGAWLSTAWQTRYKNMTVPQMKAYFIDALDKLKNMNVNAVIFQARPQADAFYRSSYEPWSAWMTGQQGKAPDGHFDLLEFLVKECHSRNMELHAWLNPYRVTLRENEQLAPDHIYFRYPERFVKYGGKIYFDPGIPENRKYICSIVNDIVMRYQVDAIHMDDYFYPYPVAGEQFPDDNSFNTYGRLQGYDYNQRDEWRRNNVNMLIQDIKMTIASIKPWVRFGISPFGIYRNKVSTADGSGSDTNGLQNYDNLYADVKLWVKKGWIDYNIPQVYWEIGHKAADYATLVKWWAENNFEQPLYIGQDVKRTMDATSTGGKTQLEEKIVLSRAFPTISGNCFWPAYELIDNYKNIAEELVRTYQRYPALIPPYTHMHNKSPKKISDLKEEYTRSTHRLSWNSDQNLFNPETARYFVVYRFPKGVKENLEDVRYIVNITQNSYYDIPYDGLRGEYKYVVTAVDAFHNESKGKSKKVKI